MGVTVAQQLGAFFAEIAPQDLPAETRMHAAMCAASTIASAACGMEIDSTRIMRRLAIERGGPPEATVWFTAAHGLPAASAAQSNAVASDAAASDDSDLRNIVHSGSPASAVALGFAEAARSPGTEVLTAIALGCEAAGRIAAAVTPGFRQRGFHGSIGAVFAATVAAGRVLALDGTQMAEALALAATSIGGLTMAADTSTAREYHAGVAVWQGTQAALAASEGFHTELAIFEGKAGFFAAFGGTDPDEASERALAELGAAYDIDTNVAIKLVPGSHYFHAIAEAAALAAIEGDVHPRDVAAITVSRPDLGTLKGPRHPDDLVTMAHSPAYFAAAGLADRTFGWQHASAERINDPTIQALCDLVVFVADPEVEVEAARYQQGATVTIVTNDRREVRRTVYVPSGAFSRGVTWDAVDEKYRALVPTSGLPSAQLEESLQLVHDLDELEGVSNLTALLRVDEGSAARS